jgi:predicted peptidase
VADIQSAFSGVRRGWLVQSADPVRGMAQRETIIGSVEGGESAVPISIRATQLVKEASMRGMAFMLLTGIVIGGLASARVRGDEPKAEAGKQVATTFDGNVHVTLKYLLYLPPDYDKHDKWPLVLFLHGAGERGDDLNAIKRHGPPKLIEGGKQFPFIVVSPQCPKDHWWNNELVTLTALLDEVVAKHKVDQDRVYLTGLSMGGFGTWALAGSTPNRFAALIPICGGGEPLLTRALKHVPVWAFHGGKDPIVPVKRSQDLIEALQRNHGDAKITIYPEAGHDSWTATYDNPEIYEWLLSHKRTAKPEG